jgi:hypothetical protein
MSRSYIPGKYISMSRENTSIFRKYSSIFLENIFISLVVCLYMDNMSHYQGEYASICSISRLKMLFPWHVCLCVLAGRVRFNIPGGVCLYIPGNLCPYHSENTSISRGVYRYVRRKYASLSRGCMSLYPDEYFSISRRECVEISREYVSISQEYFSIS